MSSEQQNLWDFKDALCKAFCEKNDCVKTCVIKKITAETYGKMQMKDILKVKHE